MFEVTTDYAGLKRGDSVPILDKANDWVKVVYRGILFIPRQHGFIRGEKPEYKRAMNRSFARAFGSR